MKNKFVSAITIFSLTILFLFSFHTSSFALMDVSIPAEVMVAAKANLAKAINQMSKRYVDYGFSREKDVAQLEVGNGIQLYYIDPGLLETSKGDSLLALVQNKSQPVWRFTLMADQKPQTFLLVGQGENGYHLLGYGGNANLYEQSFQRLSALIAEKGIPAKPVLVQAAMDFFLVADTGTEELVLPVENNFLNDEYLLNHFLSVPELISAMQKSLKESDPTMAGSGSIFEYLSRIPADSVLTKPEVNPVSWKVLMTIAVAAGMLIILLVAGIRWMRTHSFRMHR